MGPAELFEGNALNAVDAKGRLSVPAFVRSIVEIRAPDNKLVIVRKHESDPCLVGYDKNYKAELWSDVTRLRHRDEQQGIDGRPHHVRSRRSFGFSESCPYDSSGRIVLSDTIRKIGGIEELVMFVGAGATFELWNPRRALESEDEEFRLWTACRLEEKGVKL